MAGFPSDRGCRRKGARIASVRHGRCRLPACAIVRALGGLEVGQAAPLLEFAASDGGEPVQLSRSVLVFTSEGCSPCESLVADVIIHPFDPGEWGRVLVWDAKDQSPIPPLPDWVVVGATSATALKSRFQVAVWRRDRRRWSSRRSRDPEQSR